jgi:predicted ATP-dependent endonuclease of OLD family
MVKCIILNDEHTREFEIVLTNGYISPLARLNLFIGPNNSGKSRVIRSIISGSLSGNNKLDFIEEEGLAKIKEQYLGSIANLFETTTRDFLGKVNFDNKYVFTELISNIKNVNTEVNYYQYYMEAITMLKNININSFVGIVEGLNLTALKTRLNNNIQRIIDQQRNLLKTASNLKTIKREYIYIPVLRGLRPFYKTQDGKKELLEDVYYSRTVEDYFSGPEMKSQNMKNKIFSGLKIYDEITKLLLGDENERNLIKEFEEFLSIKLFNREKVTLIPKYKDDVLHVKIGKERQRAIYNLGDGLQSIIAILFPIYIRKENNAFFFIEEPEIHLHPKHQKLLLETITEMDKHQYFITTHSSAIINFHGTTIYKVYNIDNIVKVQNLSLNEGKRDLLMDLGYSASDFLLQNYVLWVEGPSDKIYMEHWINIMSSGEIVRGKHYEIMMYHGSFQQHIEVDLFAGLSMNFGVYIDSDKNSEDSVIDDEKLRIAKILEGRNKYYWISNKRAIENYVPHSFFLDSVKTIYSNFNSNEISIDEGDFTDRNFFMYKDIQNNFKQRILIPDELWARIQKNGKGKTEGIDMVTLRKGIDQAINNTLNNKIKINKVKLAKEVVKRTTEVVDSELENKILELIKEIKLANSILNRK